MPWHITFPHLYFSNGLPMPFTMYAFSNCYFKVQTQPNAHVQALRGWLQIRACYHNLRGSLPLPSRGHTPRHWFHNSPQFHFSPRKNVWLSIDTDNTDESELKKVKENASELLREFETCVVCTSFFRSVELPFEADPQGDGVP
ncbi:hypothetical protein CKAN_01231500 [Cinnamomum micranthum f. kanehirae]|uniref:Uncharacterized protein n=1 Tax=Cinnamomum micranthum f. kanehirae TaxID=337451 RepID=A0A443NYE8_9MAGN|nr:hypothetical protein CKAN_01231500 [Cinnamomum micranthum f. kanehirae]